MSYDITINIPESNMYAKAYDSEFNCLSTGVLSGLNQVLTIKTQDVNNLNDILVMKNGWVIAKTIITGIASPLYYRMV